MAAVRPTIGDWFRVDRGELFEVVAYDADDGTVELQYFDGTVEEMDIEDWNALADENALQETDPPEDWSGSVDAEIEDLPRATSDNYDDSRRQWASPLDGLDMFD